MVGCEGEVRQLGVGKGKTTSSQKNKVERSKPVAVLTEVV